MVSILMSDAAQQQSSFCPIACLARSGTDGARGTTSRANRLRRLITSFPRWLPVPQPGNRICVGAKGFGAQCGAEIGTGNGSGRKDAARGRRARPGTYPGRAADGASNTSAYGLQGRGCPSAHAYGGPGCDQARHQERRQQRRRRARWPPSRQAPAGRSGADASPRQRRCALDRRSDLRFAAAALAPAVPAGVGGIGWRSDGAK